MLKVNTTLAAGNYRRFRRFHSWCSLRCRRCLPIRIVVFKYLNRQFTEADFRYAQSHRFTSFLALACCVLWMVSNTTKSGRRSATTQLNGLTMFSIGGAGWPTSSSKIAAITGGILVNPQQRWSCCSRLEAAYPSRCRWLLPNSGSRNGKLTTVVTSHKMARGEMSRMILEGTTSRGRGFKSSAGEFMFRPDLSDSKCDDVWRAVWNFLNIYNLYPVVFIAFFKRWI